MRAGTNLTKGQFAIKRIINILAVFVIGMLVSSCMTLEDVAGAYAGHNAYSSPQGDSRRGACIVNTKAGWRCYQMSQNQCRENFGKFEYGRICK